MPRHLTNEEILDLLAPDREAGSDVRAHLEACKACRARVDAERPLTEKLAGLPRETDPPRDLWPKVDARIATEPRVSRPSRRISPALRAAAAVAIFVAGAVIGRWSAPAAANRGAPLTHEPLAAAAEVQRAGTEYVATVAHFRATAGNSSPKVVDQAREATLAAILGAAWELSSLRPDDPAASEILTLVSKRRLVEERP